jgi:hypothetical protein
MSQELNCEPREEDIAERLYEIDGINIKAFRRDIEQGGEADAIITYHPELDIFVEYVPTQNRVKLFKSFKLVGVRDKMDCREEFSVEDIVDPQNENPEPTGREICEKDILDRVKDKLQNPVPEGYEKYSDRGYHPVEREGEYRVFFEIGLDYFLSCEPVFKPVEPDKYVLKDLDDRISGYRSKDIISKL